MFRLPSCQKRLMPGILILEYGTGSNRLYGRAEYWYLSETSFPFIPHLTALTVNFLDANTKFDRTLEFPRFKTFTYFFPSPAGRMITSSLSSAFRSSGKIIVNFSFFGLLIMRKAATLNILHFIAPSFVNYNTLDLYPCQSGLIF